MRMFLLLLAGILLLTPTANAQPLVPMFDSGSTSFGDWRFSWEIGSAHNEALVLKDVRWKGIKVLHKASMPVIRVKYRGNTSDIDAGCGPYTDRIGSNLLSHVIGQTTNVVARFFGDNLMELAVFAEIGG
jgi:hypothetical protein